MSNTNFENNEYSGAKIRTYSYEGGRQFGVDVFYGDHEYHRDGFPTRTQAMMHGQEYVNSLPKPKPKVTPWVMHSDFRSLEEARRTWNQEAMAEHASTAYGGL